MEVCAVTRILYPSLFSPIYAYRPGRHVLRDFNTLGAPFVTTEILELHLQAALLEMKMGRECVRGLRKHARAALNIRRPTVIGQTINMTRTHQHLICRVRIADIALFYSKVQRLTDKIVTRAPPRSTTLRVLLQIERCYMSRTARWANLRIQNWMFAC